MKVLIGGKLPIKSWCSQPEQSAIDQAYNLTNLPFAFRHIALMPDTHFGYGMPIGGVLAVKNVVIPNAVGVDIGCGMGAVKTTLKGIDINDLKNIMKLIRQEIPVGFKHHDKGNDAFMPGDKDYLRSDEDSIVRQEYISACRQLATLGGGNHFIEIQQDTEGNIWFMIHSGSRNLGFKVATHYNKLAKEINAKWYSSVDPKHDLAFLSIDTEEGQMYLKEMDYCLMFAEKNRARMLSMISDIFQLITKCNFVDEINIHHNYARMENHFGENVMIHRKGATSAKAGERGIIPGSQGTFSYIVEGLGNLDSFMSCSHGAGRVMGRKQAKKELDLVAVQAKLDAKGILHSVRNKENLDEAPEAYKDIDIVIKEQHDLVKALVKLKPLAVIKG